MAYRRNGAAVAFASVALPAIDDRTRVRFHGCGLPVTGEARPRACRHRLWRTASATSCTAACLAACARSACVRFSDYRDYLAANSAELESFINAISTNLTKFFREAHHFRAFAHACRGWLCANRGAQAGCALEDLVGRMLDWRGALHNRCRTQARNSAISIVTTSAFSPPTSTPRCSRKACAENIRLASIEDVPRPYRDFFRTRIRCKSRGRLSWATSCVR